MRNVRSRVLVPLLVALALALPATATPQHSVYLPIVAAQSGSTLPLLNPGFESGFREVDGVHELKVANDWQPWWDEDSARPEYKRADPIVDSRRVRTGDSAQQWFNTYAKHTAGIYQRVTDVPVDKTVVFEAWVQAFSSSADDFDRSTGRYRMRIGIDPYGGLDHKSPDIAWSDDGHAIEPYDQYEFLSVQTVARSDRVTIFVWGQAEWPLKHNNAYCDDTKLYVLDGSIPSPSPGGLTEEQVREIVRQEIADAIRAWANSLE